jgi:site-specific DNA-cytosine methylase
VPAHVPCRLAMCKRRTLVFEPVVILEPQTITELDIVTVGRDHPMEIKIETLATGGEQHSDRGKGLLNQAMELLGVDLDKHGSKMYGLRHEECRRPMLFENTAGGGVGAIVASETSSGEMKGTIVFRSVREVETREVYIELLMLRSNPAMAGVGSALLAALKALFLAWLPSDELFMVAFCLRESVGFFQRQPNGFVVDESAGEVLKGLYRHVQAQFLAEQGTTAPAWAAEWQRAKREQEKALRRAKKMPKGRAADEAEAAAFELTDKLVRKDILWNATGNHQGTERMLCVLRQAEHEEEEEEEEEKAWQKAKEAKEEVAPPSKRLKTVRTSSLGRHLSDMGSSSADPIDLGSSSEDEEDRGSGACPSEAPPPSVAELEALDPVVQQRVKNQLAQLAPPADAVRATVEDVVDGDTLWVLFEGDRVWYWAVAEGTPSVTRLVFSDSEVWQKQWKERLMGGQWRRCPREASQASSPASSVDCDPRLAKIGWSAKRLDDGRVVYEGRLKQLQRLFTAESVEQALTMHQVCQTLPDQAVLEIYGADGGLASFGRAGRPRLCRQPAPVQSVEKGVEGSKPTAEQRAAARFTFADLFTGIGGFTIVCAVRLGGLLVAACEKQQHLRAAYRGHLKELHIDVLDTACHPPQVTDMGYRCLHPIDLILAGPPCQPFSIANTMAVGEVWKRPGGNAFGELLEALEARAKQGVLDQSLLIENVVGMLQHLSAEQLAPLDRLGYHHRVYQADATIFGCATSRPRITIVAFRDPAALKRFGNGPRPTHPAAGEPLYHFINLEYNDTQNSPAFLWLRHKTARDGSYMHKAAHAGSQVVSPITTEVMAVRTKANATYTPDGNGGTFVCVHESVAGQRERLSDAQLQRFAHWFVKDPDREPIYRKLHPTEELRAMSWRDHEMPPHVKPIGEHNPTDVYSAISESLCPNVFEAFAARMLWAMGKALAPGIVVEEARAEHIELKRNDKSGVEYIKLKGLSTTGSSASGFESEPEA